MDITPKDGTYAVRMFPLPYSDDAAIVIYAAAHKDSYKRCHVSTWYEQGGTIAPRDGAYDFIFRVEKGQSMDDVLKKFGYEFADDDRMRVRRFN